jgi:NAD(P)-dependent dehydrogenase (short-subunit alcohol dehydrogenase family)
VGRLDDKVAVVTGAARGLGRAVAEAYAAEGATVVVSDVDGEGAGRVADALGGRASSAVCDVTDEAAVAELVDGAVERHGRLDVWWPTPAWAARGPCWRWTWRSGGR